MFRPTPAESLMSLSILTAAGGGKVSEKMRREDMEFWNGALKGVLGAEQELREIAKRASGRQTAGLRAALRSMRNYRRRLERLHASGMREFLEQFRE